MCGSLLECLTAIEISIGNKRTHMYVGGVPVNSIFIAKSQTQHARKPKMHHWYIVKILPDGPENSRESRKLPQEKLPKVPKSKLIRPKPRADITPRRQSQYFLHFLILSSGSQSSPCVFCDVPASPSKGGADATNSLSASRL